MKFKELYLKNGCWSIKTIIRVRVDGKIERMTAYDTRKKYGERTVCCFYNDDVVLD